MPFDSDEIWSEPASRDSLLHALYFSIYPPVEIAMEAHRLAGRLRRVRALGARPTALARLHVSMNGIAKFAAAPGEDWIEQAKAAADKVGMPAFHVSLDQVQCWGPTASVHPWVLTGGDRVGFDLLHAELDGAMRWNGRPRPTEGFNPHMTLLRDPRPGVEETVAPLTWKVEEFCLVHSEQGRGVHNILGRWRLG